MNKKIISLTLMGVVSLILVGCSTGDNQKKIALAQCLTDKGAIMHGTNRCSHCNAQKEAFGYEAFAKINFVDCDRNKNVCDLAGVQGYPTWILADKTKLEGEQSLEKLAQAAGCEYSESSTNTATGAPATEKTPAITVISGSQTTTGSQK